MASVKVKLRKSDRKGCRGVLFIQVINKRRVGMIRTQFKLYPHEWDNVYGRVCYDNANRSRVHSLNEIQSSINAEMLRLGDLMNSLKRKGIDSVEEIVYCFQHHRLSVNLLGYMEQIVEPMRMAGQHKSAEMVDTVRRSLAVFLQEIDIRLSLVDSTFVKQYESYLQTKRLMPNSTSCYLRVLRSVYNRAVEEGLSPQRIPFKKVYTGVAKTSKRSVDETVIQNLQKFDLSEYPTLAFARDIFMFSFYTRGMSFVDMANLTSENICDGYICYGRSKTGAYLSVKIEPCIRVIIERYRKYSHSSYLLPIRHSDGEEHSNRLRSFNKRLLKISELMGLEHHLSSYTARHSWATIALRRGVSVRVISESMGHVNEKTTSIYLASLDQNVLDRANVRVIRRFS